MASPSPIASSSPILNSSPITSHLSSQEIELMEEVESTVFKMRRGAFFRRGYGRYNNYIDRD